MDFIILIFDVGYEPYKSKIYLLYLLILSNYILEGYDETLKSYQWKVQCLFCE